MKEIFDYIDDRRLEFERHLDVARLLEARVDEGPTPNAPQVEVRHVNTIKSGLLIHLYNIVEATTTRIMEFVGQTVVTEKPKLWTEVVRKEWIRAEIWDGTERLGDGAVTRLLNISGVLASGNAPTAFTIKGEPGSWDYEAIKKVAKRLGCQLSLSHAVKRRAFERVYRNDTTAMQYLASRRNAIAHGATTFEEGAHDQTLDDISQLADRILPFLYSVAESFEAFLTSKSYLIKQQETA